MKSYYYPISSQDFTFENIFSSESISPPQFYAKRGFGISYWPVLTGYQLHEVIVLYDKIPLFEVAHADAVRFVLEVYEPALDLSYLQGGDAGIFFYPKTIYLAKQNFRIIFFSDRDRMLTLLRSETSLPTKDLLKYRTNLIVVSKDAGKKFETSGLRPSTSPDMVDREIQFDRKLNFFKGFIYGVAVGHLANSVPQELLLKKRLREISNRFSELNNRVETSKQLSLSPRGKDGSVLLLIKELNDLLEKTREIGATVFPKPNVTEADLENFLSTQYPGDFDLISPRTFLAYKRIDDKIFNRNEYQKIVAKYIDQHAHESPMGVFIEMRRHLEEYYSNVFNVQQKGGQRHQANEAFKSNLGAFESFLDKQIAERSALEGFDLSAIQYDINSKTVNFKENFEHGHSVDLHQLSMLVNIVLSNPREKVGSTGRDTLIGIVENAKMHLPEGIFLTELYNYLANESQYFSIEKINSVVLKNFVAFIFNPDSIEKLSSFSQAKNLKEQWIGYALWCSYNGFANISKNFLRPVFDAEANPVQGYIDFYLFQIFSLRTMQDYILHRGSAEEPTNEIELTDDLQKLYNSYFAHINGMSREQFMNLVNVTDRSKFVKILRDSFRLSKNDGAILFERLTDLGMNRLL